MRISLQVRRRLYRIVGNVLVLLGLVVVLFAVAYQGYSYYAQIEVSSLNQEAEPAALVSAAPQPAAPAPELPQPDVPAASIKRVQMINPHPSTWIQIPSIGVDSKVVELGVEYRDGELVWQTADHAVGHYKATANPGDIGNIVLSGHISSPLRGEGEVFKNLPKIKVGAEVKLLTDGGVHFYKVTGTQVVFPTETRVMDPTSEETLTLITCVPDWVYSHRLIVTAKPVAVTSASSILQ